MVLQRKTSRGDYTTIDLQRSLINLLKAKSFEQFAVNYIAKEAGISRATFYRHFPTTRAVLDSIVEQPITDFIDLALSRFAYHGASVRSLKIIEMVLLDLQLWRMLLTSGARSIVLQELAGRARSRGSEIAPFIQPRLPPDHSAAWTVTGTFEVLAWWLEQGDSFPNKETARLLDRLTVNPALQNRVHG